MSRVFVVQEPLRKEGDGSVGPRFDLRPLERYGEIIMLLGWSDLRPPVNERAVMRKLGDAFEKYGGFGKDDYLVPTGHPAAIAMAALVAYDSAPLEVRLLVWDGKFRKYDVVTLNLDDMNR